ncbi:MAG: hypothetical protein JWL60_2123 [Gemmatimonadetes bacterium]|jgi:hypothetical protein|nr:hypothetical protein [Gemmatimonadota bacterium]
MSRRTPSPLAGTLIALLALLAAAPAARAQRIVPSLPVSRADALLAAGQWEEAEDAYYALSRVRPREPNARAALGRYLAMKGAIVPGTILIEEAQKFGLDPATTRALLAPWRDVQRWRGVVRFPVDSAITVQAPTESIALFRVPLPLLRGRERARVWADVVPRFVGIDTVSARPRVGLEVMEQLVPSFDVGTRQVTFHADPKAALKAVGQRYRVLRTESDVRVQVAPGRVLSLAPALRELDARWWQLDLPHGVLVVR